MLTLMDEKGTWVALYATAFSISVAIVTLVAKMQHFSTPGWGYAVFLAVLVNILLFAPFFVVTLRGLGDRQRRVQLALGRSFVVVAFVSDVSLLQFALFGAQTYHVVFSYFLDLLVASAVLWYFELPSAYVIMAILLPWPALFYFLVYGQLRKQKVSEPLLV